MAACVEFIHTATLLHDDVIDKSELRRGNQTANSIWGNEASILVGDFLLSKSFQLMVSDESLKVMKILSDTSAIISEGEVMQLTYERDLDTSEPIYLEIIKAKTAQLFAACCEIGAVVAEAGEIKENALHEFGKNLGIAFQIMDDVLDYSAKQEELGKKIGDDFRDGKITLPVILAYRRSSNEDKKFWDRCFRERKQDEDDLAKAISLIKKHEILEESVGFATKYVEEAKRALKVFKESPEKSALIELLNFSINRPY